MKQETFAPKIVIALIDTVYSAKFIRWGSFESPDGIYKEIDMLRSYEMALKTWSDWLEINVNRTRTKLFFISMSPAHLRYDRFLCI